MNNKYYSLIIIIIIIIGFNEFIQLSVSLSSSSSSSHTIDDFNIYVKNWGFEFDDDGSWIGNLNETLQYSLSDGFHLKKFIQFGNITSQIEQQIQQSVFIPNFNYENEQLKLEFSILYPTTTTTIINDFIDLTIQLDNIILFQYNSSMITFDEIIPNYQTYLIDLNNQLFANNNFHNLTLKSNSNSQQIIFIDNILIYKLPIKTIKSNLYISMNGDDINGNGTIISPFRTIQKGIDSIDTSSGFNSIYIMDGYYEFQSDETVFNRGKRINIFSLENDGSKIEISISTDYNGYFFVAASPICFLNFTTTTTTATTTTTTNIVNQFLNNEMILNCQNYFNQQFNQTKEENQILMNQVNFLFLIKDLEFSNIEINLNCTFSTTQYASMQIEGIVSTSIPLNSELIVGNKGSLIFLYDCKLNVAQEFGVVNVIFAAYSTVFMDSIEFICSSESFVFTCVNLSVTNVFTSGLCNFVVGLELDQTVVFENLTHTNITSRDNPIYMLEGVDNDCGANFDQLAIFRNITVYDCDTLSFLWSFICGTLIVDEVQISGIQNLRAWVFITNNFIISNVQLFESFSISDGTIIPVPISKITGSGVFNNILISQYETTTEDVNFFRFLNGCVIFNNFTYSNTMHINFATATNSILTFNTFNCTNINLGSLFSKGISSILYLNDILFNGNQIGLVDGSYSVVLKNSKIFDNLSFLSQRYSIPILCAYDQSVYISIQNSEFIGNQGFTLFNIINSSIFFSEVEFDSNLFGVEIVAKQSIFSASGLKLKNSYSTSYSSSISLLAMISVYLVYFESIGSSFPLNITNCNDIYFRNANFINSTGSENVIYIFGSTGNWGDSFIYGTSTSVLAPPLYHDHSSISFANVTFSSISSSNYPYGIYINSNVSFSNCLFSTSTDVVNGGLFLGNTNSAVFTDCKFTDNSNKNAIIVSSFSMLELDNCTFSNNNALSTSCVSVENSNFTINGCLFIRNTLSPSLNVTHSFGNIINSYFIDNNSPSSIILSDHSNYSINNTIITNNQTKTYGSFSFIQDNNSSVSLYNSNISSSLSFNTPPFYFGNSSVRAKDCFFSENVNLGGSGGVFYLYNSNAHISRCTFQNNNAQFGGAIYSQRSTTIISSSLFFRNNATGGSIFYYLSNSTVSSSNFTYNTAKPTSIYSMGFKDSNSLLSSGGSIYVSKENLDNNNNIPIPRVNATIATNTITLQECYFTFNSAVKSGGAIYNDHQYTEIDIIESSFNGNEAISGGAIYSLYQISETLSFFSGNKALYGYNIASNISIFSLELAYANDTQVLTPFQLFIFPLDIFGNDVSADGTTVFYINLKMEIFSFDGKTKLNGTITQSNVFTSTFSTFNIENNQIVPVGSIYRFTVSLTEGKNNQIAIIEKVLNKTAVGCYTSQYISASGACVTCSPGSAGYNGINCFNCSDDQICPGGDQIGWSAGYWFQSGTNRIPAVYHCDSTMCIENACRQFHTGILCGECQTGKFSKSMTYCILCEDNGEIFLLYLYFFFVVVVAILLLFYEMPNRSILSSSFSAIQMISMFAQKTDTYSFYHLFNFRIDFIPQLCSMDINFFQKSFIGYASMVFIIFSTSILKSLRSLDKILQLKKMKKTNIKPPFVNNFISTSILFFIPTCIFSFQSLNCVDINGTKYLSYDTSLTCFTSQHVIAMVISCVFLSFYIGILVYFFLLLVRNQSLNWFFSKFSRTDRKNTLDYNQTRFQQQQIENMDHSNNRFGSKRKLPTEFLNYGFKNINGDDQGIDNVKDALLQRINYNITFKKSIYFTQFKFKNQFSQPLQMIFNLLIIIFFTSLISTSSTSELIILTIMSVLYFIQLLNLSFKISERNYTENIFGFVLIFAAILNNSRFFKSSTVGYILLSFSSIIFILTIIYYFKKLYSLKKKLKKIEKKQFNTNK